MGKKAKRAAKDQGRSSHEAHIAKQEEAFAVAKKEMLLARAVAEADAGGLRVTPTIGSTVLLNGLRNENFNGKLAIVLEISSHLEDRCQV